MIKMKLVMLTDLLWIVVVLCVAGVQWVRKSNARKDGVLITSDNFTHDVKLHLDGDFSGDEQRKRYADHLASKLNRPLSLEGD